jgi:hypothetical protein
MLGPERFRTVQRVSGRCSSLLDEDLVSSELDSDRFHRFYGRESPGRSGCQVESRSVILAHDGGSLKLTVRERQVLVGAAVTEGVDRAIDVGQDHRVVSYHHRTE